MDQIFRLFAVTGIVKLLFWEAIEALYCLLTYCGYRLVKLTCVVYSDRNTSRGSLQLPPSSSADPFAPPPIGHNSYSNNNPGMLSFGSTNGLASSFPYPPGFTPQSSGFPFGSSDLLQSFPHGAPFAAASEYCPFPIVELFVYCGSNFLAAPVFEFLKF